MAVDRTRRANRLALSRSPYLLQHAHNPVDWREWGEEAFAEARHRDVPVFLSIGYSTCYWCHVMERESFEDDATARVMNERFVCVKVDREERPDVDDIYMAAVQMLTGRGGWPMSVFLEPATLRPYWGGTYFPPREAHGLPSFRRALEGMSDAYREKRGDVLKQAGAIAAAVAEKLSPGRGAAVHIGRPQGAMAVRTLLTIVDRTHGGFGGAPKFPQPVYLELLLDARERAGEEAGRAAMDAALRLTLDRMAMGGMFDQVGGGFHRYSVDAYWLVPHFEKMLYDNAQLLRVYARAAAAFDDAFYRGVAERTAGYVLREMTGADGAFFTAQDAEVEGREGLNYVWTPEQVRGALQGVPGGSELALDVYGLNAGANFQDPHHPDEPARNVLHLGDRPEATAARLGLSADEFGARMDAVNAALLQLRGKRVQPRRDEKVITGWNGLMIGALADAGRWLGRGEWIGAAERGAAAVLGRAMRADGTLPRTGRAGEQGAIEGVLEDYAMLAEGLCALARAKGEGQRGGGEHLRAARVLVERAAALFGDAEGVEGGAGGWWDTRADRADLFVRARGTYDGAMPSGVSVMLHALVSLAQLTGEGKFARRAGAGLAAISGAVRESPIATANSTRALLRLIDVDEAALVESLRVAGAPDVADGGVEAGARMSAAEASDAGTIRVMASAEEIDLAEGEPVELSLRCVIAEGYAVGAAESGAEDDEGGGGGLRPFRVVVAGGTGVEVYADYPVGEAGRHGGEVRGRWYSGTLDLTVVLEREGAWSGEPCLVLEYQACGAGACLAPERLRLGIRLRAVE